MPRTKSIDKMGRLTLGREYAGKTVMIKKLRKGKFVITVGQFVPEEEAWLYKNPKSLALVRQGLKESIDGAAASPAPDLETDAASFPNDEEGAGE